MDKFKGRCKNIRIQIQNISSKIIQAAVGNVIISFTLLKKDSHFTK